MLHGLFHCNEPLEVLIDGGIKNSKKTLTRYKKIDPCGSRTA